MLCIFLCFALGIANIFHANFVIAFSIICLYVATRLTRCRRSADEVSQSMRLRHHIYRDPATPSHLPDLAQVRHVHS